jgi:hypothetical protein
VGQKHTHDLLDCWLAVSQASHVNNFPEISPKSFISIPEKSEELNDGICDDRLLEEWHAHILESVICSRSHHIFVTGTPFDSLAIQTVSVDGMNALNVEEHQLVVIAGSGNSEIEAEGQVQIFLFDPLDECHDLLEEDVVDDSDSFLHVGLDLLAEILGELKGTAAMLISEEARKLGMPVVIPLALLVERQHLSLVARVHEVCRQDEDGLLQWSEAADDLRLTHVGDVDVEHLLTPDHLSKSCFCSEVV